MDTRTYSNANSIVQINGENLKQIKVHAQIMKDECIIVVDVEGQAYFFSWSFNDNLISVNKYSANTSTMEKVCRIYSDRNHFRVCGYMGKIYIIGGCDKNLVTLKFCRELDIKTFKHKQIQRMNEARSCLASTVFEGRIVVSGGFVDDNEFLNTVETYDHVANTWSTCLV